MNGWGILIVRESCGETGYEVLAGGGNGANGQCMAWKRFDSAHDAETWILHRGAAMARDDEQIVRFDIFEMHASYLIDRNGWDGAVGARRLRGAHS